MVKSNQRKRYGHKTWQDLLLYFEGDTYKERHSRGFLYSMQFNVQRTLAKIHLRK